MEVHVKLIVIGALSCAIAGALIQRHYDGSVETKTQVITKDHTVTVIKEVKSPDGTVTKDTTITDDNTQKAIQQIIDTRTAVPQWLVAAGVSVNANRVKIYSLSVDRKILGPISIGIIGSTDSELGLRLGVSF